MKAYRAALAAYSAARLLVIQTPSKVSLERYRVAYNALSVAATLYRQT